MTRSSFQVHVSGAGADAPAPDTLLRCRQWFESRGATCHEVAAGLVCTMGAEEARELFGFDPAPGSELPIPKELSDAVEAITVPIEPTFFGPPGGSSSSDGHDK